MTPWRWTFWRFGWAINAQLDATGCVRLWEWLWWIPRTRPEPVNMMDVWEAEARFDDARLKFSRWLQEMEDAKPGPKSLYDPRP